MPLTVNQVVEETQNWPREQLAELVDILNRELNGSVDPGHKEAWRSEIRRRVEELESGKVEPIPGDQVSAKIREIVGR